MKGRSDSGKRRSTAMRENLKCYLTTLEFWCWDEYSVYLSCKPANFDPTRIAYSLPITIELDRDRCFNLDKLEKGVPIRWFFRPYQYPKKERVEIFVDGEWIPIYRRR